MSSPRLLYILYLLITLLTTALPADISVPEADSPSGFYHVSGAYIEDSAGNPVWLKGISIGNMLWSSLEPVTNDHNEESFREISELGFNCIRFYLSYTYFEDEANPYAYKESGFAWLDQNIAWAKEHNIRLILNMHVPQGGYQSQGEGLALWQNEENQNRLVSLWTEIARRYADEETIIGYGLINEPVVPLLNDVPSTTAQCSSLMQRIADGIRTYDSNHILFVERLFAMIDTATGEANWHITYDDVLYLIEDDNTAYEFHNYQFDFNYDQLEDSLLPYLNFREKHQVPVYLGEFGVYYTAWQEGSAAGQWVTDMLTLCKKYEIPCNYHAYHDGWFGLYTLPMDHPDSERNEELAEIFEEMLKE